MDILNFLSKDTIIDELESQDKKGVLKELTAPVAAILDVKPEILMRVLMEREKLGSTGIGDGLGLPHGKLKEIDSLVLGVGISKKGVDFNSLDKKPAHIFFMLLTPENSTDLHLKLLAQISRLLKNELFRQKLLDASGKEELFSIITEEAQHSRF